MIFYPTAYAWNTPTQGGHLQSIQTGVIQNQAYTYDAAGNITQIVNGVKPLETKSKIILTPMPPVAFETQSYTYDFLHRLTSWTLNSQPSESYAYNSSTGNLMPKGATTLQYNNASHPHAVSNVGSNTYAYDANGNQTTRVIASGSLAGTYNLSYDAENRLVQVKKNNSAIATYTYDADGRQVKSVVNSVTTLFVGAHYQVEGELTTKYYLAGGQRIAMRTPNNSVSYLLTDHLGSTSLTTNSTGVVTSELRYSPWGETRYTSGTSPTNYRFTGQRQEASFGLYFYNARWYDNYLNHMTQPDTIVPTSAQGVQAYDRYAYSNNNPLKYADPSGHMAEQGDGGDYYQGCKPKCNGAIDFLTNLAIGADHVGAIVSMGEAAIADIFIGATVTVAIAQPETAPDILLAVAADSLIANAGAPIENTAGGVSLGATTIADIMSGNTRVSNDGLYISKDTIVAARNTVLGLIPESNLDAAVSISQVKYDMDRINGTKPGGSINVTKNPMDLLDQVLWYDSPAQDFVNFLASFK